jgi:hypothetical protein
MIMDFDYELWIMDYGLATMGVFDSSEVDHHS